MDFKIVIEYVHLLDNPKSYALHPKCNKFLHYTRPRYAPQLKYLLNLDDE